LAVQIQAILTETIRQVAIQKNPQAWKVISRKNPTAGAIIEWNIFSYRSHYFIWHCLLSS